MRHVPHLYLPGEWQPSRIEVGEAQERHLIKVLRLDDGEAVTYTNGTGAFGIGIWLGGGYVERGDEQKVPRPSNMVIAVAPPANRDRVRFIVEKLSELGVKSLRWLATRHGEGRNPKADKQLAWAVSGLEQSRGAWLMGLDSEMVGWNDLERPIAVFVRGGSDIHPNGVGTFVVGPEGGWDREEIPENSHEIDLGPTILRVETAAIVAAATFR